MNFCVIFVDIAVTTARRPESEGQVQLVVPFKLSVAVRFQAQQALMLCRCRFVLRFQDGVASKSTDSKRGD